MEKPLSEYTLEELWHLFPIELKAYNCNYIHQYETAYKELSCLLGKSIIRISHIGSTYVKGLIAKPIVDILLEIPFNENITDLINILSQNNWILMSQDITPEKVNLSFNKGYTPQGFAHEVFHLHVRYYGDWDELYFRDYLIDYPAVARKYEHLKKSLLAKYQYNRDAYTKEKTDFIVKYTKLARIKYGHKYTNN